MVEARILATGGAGQVALWEDVAGRTGDLALLRAMRERIVQVAPNTGAAQQAWRGRPDAYDAWLVWNIWQVAAPELADIVEIEEPFRIWRSTGTVLTRRARKCAVSPPSSRARRARRSSAAWAAAAEASAQLGPGGGAAQ